MTSTRPDIAVTAGLLQQRITRATVQDLIEANKLVGKIHDHAHIQITIRPIPLDRGVFVLSTDASWSNCDDLRSQGGYFVALADETFLNGKAVPLSPLRWKSYKLERHCQSTLGSELMSLSRGIAEGEWIRSLFGEALNPDYQLKEDKRFSEKIGMVCLIDNKPIYDHQIGDGIVVKNKREAIDMLMVRRDFRENNMKLSWIETNNMLADVLTKENAPVALLLFVLRGGGYSLKSFDNF